MTSPSPRAPRVRRCLVAALGAIAAATALALVPAATLPGAGAAAKAPTSRCYGAAARAPGHRCASSARWTRVTPTPTAAPLIPDAPCTPVEQDGILNVCAFGTAARSAKQTVVLLGDSHASHWRAALGVAALGEGWRGLSMTRSSCPFTKARPRIALEAQRPCRDNNTAAIAWLTAHPEVHTVFVSAHSGARVFRQRPGATMLDTKAAGYSAAWAALPASVRQVYVLRDVPTHPLRTADCIDAALAARRPPVPACDVRRKGALLPDPEVVAANRVPSSRVQVIDLTAFMCGPARCSPVVGGVLVNKDTDHLSRAFSETLGPYLLSRVLRLRRAS